MSADSLLMQVAIQAEILTFSIATIETRTVGRSNISTFFAGPPTMRGGIVIGPQTIKIMPIDAAVIIAVIITANTFVVTIVGVWNLC
jgi:hypothetical protein